MTEPCELFKIIPREKIDHVFQTSQTVGAECDYEFLGFEKVYKAVTMFVPKSKVIIDCGCAYAFQSWYFRDYRKYIGIDCSSSINDVLQTENSEFHFVTIQHFIKNIFPTLGYSLDYVFAVCSYVPDDEAREMVRNFFPHCLVYYPTQKGSEFMELTIDKETVEIIDRYMESDKPKTEGLERICINKMCDMAQQMVIRNSAKSMIRVKGQPWINDIRNPKHDTYFQGGSWYQYSWWDGRRKWGLTYFIHGKCERYFEDNSEKIISNFLHDIYGTLENAILQTDSFMKLAEEFQNWFNERRTKFMEQTDTDIQKWKETCATSKPQSHGGVANLLKVLTKTMEKQGADIQNIAKVQYAVCVQAGIYIPDEFVRDVAVTLDMKEIEEIRENGRNETNCNL